MEEHYKYLILLYVLESMTEFVDLIFISICDFCFYFYHETGSALKGFWYFLLTSTSSKSVEKSTQKCQSCNLDGNFIQQQRSQCLWITYPIYSHIKLHSQNSLILIKICPHIKIPTFYDKNETDRFEIPIDDIDKDIQIH